MNDEHAGREAFSTIASGMARSVGALLPRVTIEGYRRFLDHMFHYTRGSGARLEHAAAHAETDAQRSFFAELAREEAQHYKLAELDLVAFGRTPSETAPSSVTAFDTAWRSWSPAGHLGALVVLESVAEHIAKDAQQNLGRLGLGRDQARFVLVHLQADIDHGARSAHELDAVLATAAPAAREAGEYAGRFWVDLHTDAFVGR